MSFVNKINGRNNKHITTVSHTICRFDWWTHPNTSKNNHQLFEFVWKTNRDFKPTFHGLSGWFFIDSGPKVIKSAKESCGRKVDSKGEVTISISHLTCDFGAWPSILWVKAFNIWVIWVLYLYPILPPIHGKGIFTYICLKKGDHLHLSLLGRQLPIGFSWDWYIYLLIYHKNQPSFM